MIEKITIFFLILPLLLFSFYIFASRKYFEFNAFEVFVIFFTIYFALVPMDHLLGLSVREHSSFLSLNFDQYHNDSSVRLIKAILMYLYFFIFVLFGYLFLKVTLGEKRSPTVTNDEVVYERFFIPSPRLLLLINIGVLYYYVSTDLEAIANNLELASSLKQVRTQVGLNVDSSYRVFSFISNLFITFNTVIIIVARNKKLTTIALTSIIIMALYMGDRSTIFIAFFIALLVHKPKIHLFKSMTAIFATMLLFIFFKPTYNFVVADLAGKDHLSLSESFAQIDFSLSRIEGLSPYEVIITVMDDDSKKLRYGESYLVTMPKTVLPGSIYQSDEETLAVEFKKVYAQSSMGYFGFSPIAEALLNFGLIGQLIIGTLFGMYLFFVASMRVGLFYYLNIMFIIRFLRTDFASLVKRYFMVESTALIISVVILVSLYYIIQILKTKNQSSNLKQRAT